MTPSRIIHKNVKNYLRTSHFRHVWAYLFNFFFSNGCSISPVIVRYTTRDLTKNHSSVQRSVPLTRLRSSSAVWTGDLSQRTCEQVVAWSMEWCKHALLKKLMYLNATSTVLSHPLSRLKKKKNQYTIQGWYTVQPYNQPELPCMTEWTQV